MSYYYLPIPPRAWSRVQNNCSIINTSIVQGDLTLDMLKKGNVLQYKANSSNLTKAQRYSKIAQGKWVNRNTTWATQSARGYTNPNTSSLKRTGNIVNVAFDPITGAVLGPTTEPITCPKPITTSNQMLPSNTGYSGEKEPDIPEPEPPTPASNVFPGIIPVTPVQPIVIQDEGVLICSVQENVCTGEIISVQPQQTCFLTTDSDVPGPIQELCWNDGLPTWYPKQRTVMTNSGDKWPVNATLLSSARPVPPILTSATIQNNNVTLIWTQPASCLPAIRYDIYQNGEIVLVVDVTESTVNTDAFTETIKLIKKGTYTYHVVGMTNGRNIISIPSNEKTVQYI